MLNLVIGAAVVSATAVAFRAAMPLDGKMRSWITPATAPYVALLITAAAMFGFGLMLASAISFFS